MSSSQVRHKHGWNELGPKQGRLTVRLQVGRFKNEVIGVKIDQLIAGGQNSTCTARPRASKVDVIPGMILQVVL